MRIAINGMGRIGRLLFKRLINRDDIEIIAINDIMPIENLVYLMKYDSVYGKSSFQIQQDQNHIIVNNHKIASFQIGEPFLLPWSDLKIDLVLECTGVFTSRFSAEKHLQAGARKVLISTTGADDVPLKVFGFNQNDGLSKEDIISIGGCMTNCSTHILYILQSIGIQSAHINILHSYTSRQELVDAPHKQLRRGRAAAESIIPVDIDLYQSLNRLLPGLKERVSTSSTRVPVANGAMANFYIQFQSEVSAKIINGIFEKAAKDEYKGILEYTEDEIVSLDIKENTHSAIIDGTQTSAIGNHLRLVAWFDNEYGFTSRMIDWIDSWR
ncbi:MAG: glyceraldehyde 3-phosphate dehydrogenase NAD-binding domain-containing protein [Ginsengibacter sp.]